MSVPSGSGRITKLSSTSSEPGNLVLSAPALSPAFGMKAVLSQFVREQTSQATRDTLRHKISEGEWVGRPPYGFAAPPEDRTKLVPLEAELKLILARAGADPARCRTTGSRPSSKRRV